MIIFYYVNRRGHNVGSLNYVKILAMSQKHSDGKVYHSDISDFEGQLLSQEWNG